MQKIDWDETKRLIGTGVRYRYAMLVDGSYEITSHDGSVNYKCTLLSGDADDFVTNYLSGAVDTLVPIDTDGASFTKTRTTKAGWHYEPRSIDFFTGTAGSLYNRKEDGATIDGGTDFGDAQLCFKDSSGTELVQGGGETDAAFQTRLDANCVLTYMDWQPTYDMDIIGGSLQIKTAPVNRAYIWANIAPDIPEASGGNIPFFAGGFNLSFFAASQTIHFDGRGVMHVPYDPVYNKSKFRFIIKHSSSDQFGVQIITDHFKA